MSMTTAPLPPSSGPAGTALSAESRQALLRPISFPRPIAIFWVLAKLRLKPTSGSMLDDGR
jgi:hypothetical protein